MQLESIRERRIALQLEAYKYIQDFISRGISDPEDDISAVVATTSAEFINKMRKIMAKSPANISTFDLMTAQLEALKACVVDISRIQASLSLLNHRVDKSCN